MPFLWQNLADIPIEWVVCGGGRLSGKIPTFSRFCSMGASLIWVRHVLGKAADFLFGFIWFYRPSYLVVPGARNPPLVVLFYSAESWKCNF